VGGVWFVMKVPFYTLMLQTKADIGNYLVDAKGMTLSPSPAPSGPVIRPD